MNTLKKMFLLTTIVLLLVGFTAVSAADTDDVTNDATLINEDDISSVSNEQNNEVSTMYESSPEEDIQAGATTTTAEPIVAIAGGYSNLTATVDRVIPGARLSEGVVEFDVNNGEIKIVDVPLKDGTATTEINIPNEWIGQSINYTATYLGSLSFEPSSGEAPIIVVGRMIETTTTISPVVGEFNKPINLTATVKTPLLGNLYQGQVYFTTNTGIIKDEDGYTLYAPVINGIATAETIAQESWLDDGDVNTITATFEGYNEFLQSTSEPTGLRIYDELINTSTEMIPPKGIYDQPINLTAKVSIENDTLNYGTVYFVIGDKIVTDEDGETLYAYVNNGVANVETIAQRSWHDGGDVFTIHAVYEGIDKYLDSESEDAAVTLVERFYNTTTTINPVIGKFNKPINLTATVKTPLLGSLNDGQVYFTTNTGIIKDEDGNILYAPVINGVATAETIAQESWLDDGDVNTITATFEGYNEFLQSTSEPTGLRIYDELINTSTEMIPPKGIYDQPINLTAKVSIENDTLNYGTVYFVIGDKIVTDEDGNTLYAIVDDGVANVETIAQRSWYDGGDVFTIQAIYEGVGPYLDSESEPVALTIDEPVNPQPKPVNPVKPIVTKKVSKTLKDTKKSDKSFKVLVKDNVVTTGNVITLGNLNNIFNKDFTNGILVVYLDGKVVFNGTTTDDLTLVILQIIESLIGEHELKVEFTDSNNETHTYTENITIQ